MIEQKILIVVEGIADAIFVRDYLSHLYKSYFIQANLKLDEKKNKTCAIDIFEKPHIRIFSTGGCARLLDLKTQLVEEFDSKQITKLLLIFDTDNTEKDFGGFEAKKRDVLEKIKEVESFAKLQSSKLKFDDVFLLPSNHLSFNPSEAEDGDIETLLKLIVKTEKYEKFISCYDAFCNCISFSDFIAEYNQTKSKIYNYIQVYQGNDLAKEKSRVYTSEFWDFEHVALNNLKEFLQRHIKVEE